MKDDEIIEKILQQSKKIRVRSRTSCIQLQNYLYYQHLKLINKNSILWTCGICSHVKIQIKKQFKRAFKALNKIQQAQFYFSNVKFVDQFLSNSSKNGFIDLHLGKQQQSKHANQSILNIKVQIKDQIYFKKFVDVVISIIPKDKIIKVGDGKINIDLHLYILRKSKHSKKYCVILEAMEPRTPAQTIKLQFSSLDFQQHFQKLFNIWSEAQYDNIKKMLISDDKFPRRIPKPIKNKQKQSETSKNNLTNSQIKNNNQNSIQNNKQNKQVIEIKIEENVVSSQLIQQLNNFQNFQQQKQGVYFQKNGNKVRKVFLFNANDINVQMIGQAIDSINQIKKRKPTIVDITLLNSIESQQKNLYKEINNFENKQYEFAYSRQYFTKNNIKFFIQKSIDCQSSKNRNNNDQQIIKGIITYCIWRITVLVNKIQLLVQADIKYNKNIDNKKKITQLYIGKFQQIFKNNSQQKKRSIQNDIIKQDSKQFQIENSNDINHSFYTVTGSLNTHRQYQHANDGTMSNKQIQHIQQKIPKHKQTKQIKRSQQ